MNIYAVGADASVTGEQIEKECIQIVRSVRKAVKIPIALKLSPYFTSFANVAKKFDDEGVNALVLFNRFLQPDIDLDRMALNSSMQLSHPWEMLLPLRWTAILHGRVKADLAASTGVHDTTGVVKMLLAGATVVQLAASLLRNGVPHLAHAEDRARGLDGARALLGAGRLPRDRCRRRRPATRAPSSAHST